MCKMSSPRRSADSLSQCLSFFFAINQVKEMLLDVEQRLPPLIKVILNSKGSEDRSFSNEIIGNFYKFLIN